MKTDKLSLLTIFNIFFVFILFCPTITEASPIQSENNINNGIISSTEFKQLLVKTKGTHYCVATAIPQDSWTRVHKVLVAKPCHRVDNTNDLFALFVINDKGGLQNKALSFIGSWYLYLKYSSMGRAFISDITNSEDKLEMKPGLTWVDIGNGHSHLIYKDVGGCVVLDTDNSLVYKKLSEIKECAKFRFRL